MSICSSSAGVKRRGFSLIETAIVLAVVGMVIGSIWVAAAAVSENNRINEASAGVGRIISGLRALYGNVQLPVANTSLNSLLISSKIVPDTMITAGALKTPWGGTFLVEKLAGTNALLFSFYNTPAKSCPYLVASLVRGSSSNEVSLAKIGDNSLKVYQYVIGSSVPVTVFSSLNALDLAPTCNSQASGGTVLVRVYTYFP